MLFSHITNTASRHHVGKQREKIKRHKPGNTATIIVTCDVKRKYGSSLPTLMCCIKI